VLRKRITTALLQPRSLAGAGFLAVTAGIAANALYLQSGPHPAPLFRPGSGERIAEVVAPNELVLAVQSGLAEAGYYDGPLDGIAGPETAAAIIAFERMSGLAVTGLPSRQLVAALGAEPAGAAMGDADPDALAGAPVPGDPRVAAVQDALSRAAYGPLQADGLLGPQTEEAIRRFQADHGLAVTGELTDSLVVELRALGMLAEE
jgi:peptidoglycan hydrolase-like protein with peptidoglycan-binding domain